MELKHYVVILRRWGWVMLLCTVLAGAASYWFSSQQPRVYEARARYLVGPAIDNPNVTSNDLRASSQVGQTYTEMVTTRPIVESVIAKLNLHNDDGTPIDPDNITQNTTAAWIDGPQILSIRVRAGNPNLAAAIANALGETIIERSPSGPSSLQVAKRQDALNQIAKLQENIRSTQAEIDQLTSQVQQTTDPVSQRALIVRLDQRRAQLAASQQALSDQYAIVQSSSTNQISLLEAAVPEPVPVAPNIQQTVLTALIAGLVLGLTAMLLFEYFVDVIYTPEDLRKLTGLAYLGGLARHKKLRGNATSQLIVQARPETLAAESYRILRTNIQMASADSHHPALLITSPSRGDGKSEVAANLAVSLAQAGKRVILIDANLLRPKIATLFGLPDHTGLSSLLDMPAQTPEPLPIEAIPGLSVLPAGAPAINSSEILASERMYHLLQEFKARADVVILDSPPLLYSDALVLAPQVDGVLLVTNSATTGRANTVKAVENLRLVNAHVLGAVLNRVKPEPAYFYYPRQAMRHPSPESVIPASEQPALLSAPAHVAAEPAVASAAEPVERAAAESPIPAHVAAEPAVTAAAEPVERAAAEDAIPAHVAAEPAVASAAEPVERAAAEDAIPAHVAAEPTVASAEEPVERAAAEDAIAVGAAVIADTDGTALAEAGTEIVEADTSPVIQHMNGHSSRSSSGTASARKTRRKARS